MANDSQGIVSRTLPVRDLEMHILEAGEPQAPLLMLLHGFPELSYSWRDIILPLSHLGYRVVAPDQRGYGQTKPRNPTPAAGANRPINFNDDLQPFKMLNLVHDVVALVYALGCTSVACVVGHDFGSPVAGFSTLVRPDLFRKVVFMSAPFTGAPPLPFAVNATRDDVTVLAKPVSLMASAELDDALALLQPPRKHYQVYFSGPHANADMLGAPDGLHAFLRAYFHIKSADWAANDPRPLPPGVDGLAHLPPYYVIPREASMADVARAGAPSAAEVRAKASRWLPDDALAVYTREFGRTGFQGGLNWYRCLTDGALAEELSLFAGRTVDVPAMFLSGRQDWGVYQSAGGLEKMRKVVCTRMEDEDVILVDGAGHWVQQEQAPKVVEAIGEFLKK